MLWKAVYDIYDTAGHQNHRDMEEEWNIVTRFDNIILVLPSKSHCSTILSLLSAHSFDVNRNSYSSK